MFIMPGTSGLQMKTSNFLRFRMPISSYRSTKTHPILVKNSENCCTTRVSKLSTASTEILNSSTKVSDSLQVTAEYTDLTLKNYLYGSHPIVIAIKQTTFVQSNTTHVYSINFIALTYVLHVLAYA